VPRRFDVRLPVKDLARPGPLGLCGGCSPLRSQGGEQVWWAGPRSQMKTNLYFALGAAPHVGISQGHQVEDHPQGPPGIGISGTGLMNATADITPTRHVTPVQPAAASRARDQLLRGEEAGQVEAPTGEDEGVL